MPGLLNRIFTPWRIRKLRRDYITMHGISGCDAEQALARHIALLKSKHPGQREEWYLEKVIYDLEKDRRR